jgi:hypothetical protein
MSRLTFKRQASGSFNFTEADLAAADDLNLTNTISASAQGAVMDELVADVDRLVMESKIARDDAWKYVMRRRPRLFKLARLNPVSHVTADVTVAG